MLRPIALLLMLASCAAMGCHLGSPRIAPPATNGYQRSPNYYQPGQQQPAVVTPTPGTPLPGTLQPGTTAPRQVLPVVPGTPVPGASSRYNSAAPSVFVGTGSSGGWQPAGTRAASQSSTIISPDTSSSTSGTPALATAAPAAGTVVPASASVAPLPISIPDADTQTNLLPKSRLSRLPANDATGQLEPGRLSPPLKVKEITDLPAPPTRSGYAPSNRLRGLSPPPGNGAATTTANPTLASSTAWQSKTAGPLGVAAR